MTDWRNNVEISRRPFSVYSRKITGPKTCAVAQIDRLVDVPTNCRVVDAVISVKTADVAIGSSTANAFTLENNDGSPVTIATIADVRSAALARIAAASGFVEGANGAKFIVNGRWGTFTGTNADNTLAKVAVLISFWRDKA